MELKNLALITILISVLPLVPGCDKKENQNIPSQTVRLKGDPIVFIQNTVTEANTGIPAAMLQEDPDQQWAIYSHVLVGGPQIKNEEMLENQKPENLSKGLAPQVELTYEAQTQKSEDSKILLSPSDNNNLSFELRKEGDNFYFDSIHSPEGKLNPKRFELKHVSVKKDKSAFSFLLYGISDGYKYLASFTFSKIPKEIVERTLLDTAYSYLFGPGAKVALNKTSPVDVQICQSSLPPLDELTESAINAWQPVLKDKLTLQTKITSTCPPFSDLNTVTFQTIEGWIDVEGEEALGAFTLTNPNFKSHTINDADVFLLKDEWKEALVPKIPDFSFSQDDFVTYPALLESYRGTMTHEMGHVLGLSHVFDGRKSLMSYDGVNTIQPLDREAVEALYGE